MIIFNNIRTGEGFFSTLNVCSIYGANYLLHLPTFEFHLGLSWYNVGKFFTKPFINEHLKLQYGLSGSQFQ